jgi:glycosyltransferase involved in cell wall biosynthesis
VRILHVITTLDVGGAEMHLLEQVRGQRARGHEVRVAYLKGGGALTEDFRRAGASGVAAVGGGPALALRLWPHLGWAEIVHTHLLKADMAAAVLAALAGRRRGLVASKHNDEQVLRRLPVSLLHGLVGRLPRRTIVLSDHVGRFIEEHGRIPRRRIERIYYGVDVESVAARAAAARRERALGRAELGLAPDDLVFTCVARFAPQKAHDVLLRAFARARAAGATESERLRLLLVGGDPFGDGRRRAEALARELELGGAVVFAGIRRDVPELLGLSDVFALASLWEGLGLVFLEAMAAALPVLATRVSAVPEVVVEGETGRLVPPADDQALAKAMLELAADPGLRARLGAAGAARVPRIFGLARMIEETLAVYRGLVPEASRT